MMTDINEKMEDAICNDDFNTIESIALNPKYAYVKCSNFNMYTGDITWTKRWVDISNVGEDYFEDLAQHAEYMVIVEMSKGNYPSYSISSKPVLDEDKMLALNQKLETLVSPPRSKDFDCYFAYHITIGKGCVEPGLNFQPRPALPDEKLIQQYKSLLLEQKIKSLQDWVRSTLLPVLIYYQKSKIVPDPALNFIENHLTKDGDFDKNLINVTTDNPSYWKALSMDNEEQYLIFLSKLAMMVLKGKLDLTYRFLQFKKQMPVHSGLAQYCYHQLEIRLEEIFEEVNDFVDQGKKKIESGVFDAAESYFERLMAQFESSASIMYQYYYTKSLRIRGGDPQYIINLWADCKRKIFRQDPLFPINSANQIPAEHYRSALAFSLDFKLKDGIEKHQDLLDYATTALELNAYDFSAHLFWFLNKDLKSDFKKIDLYDYFLYALNGLENTILNDIFKDKKNAKRISRVSKALKMKMKNHVAYLQSESAKK